MISAQQLPKLSKGKHDPIVDPLVKVEIYGVPADNASKETHYINNNGEHTAYTHTQIWTHPAFFFFRANVTHFGRKYVYISEVDQLNNNPSLQGLTQCGMRNSRLTSTSQSWPCCGYWWRTMTQHPLMISSGSTVYRSPVYRTVRESKTAQSTELEKAR